MPIRAVIFDFGGVLVRTEDKAPRTRLAERFGLTYAELDRLVFDSPSGAKALVGELSEEEHMRQVCAGLGLGEAEVEAFQQAFWGGDRLDERLLAFVRSLRPRYRTALLSNAWSGLRPLLEVRLGILDAFDQVFISCELGMAKPDLRVYAHVVEKLGVRPEEAVFVDDYPANIEAAQRAGLQAVHFRSTDQALHELAEMLGQRDGGREAGQYG